MMNMKQVGEAKVVSHEAQENRGKSTDVEQDVVVIEVHQRKRSNENRDKWESGQLKMRNKWTNDRLSGCEYNSIVDNEGAKAVGVQEATMLKEQFNGHGHVRDELNIGMVKKEKQDEIISKRHRLEKQNNE